MDSLKIRLREVSGDSRIRHEAWFLTLFGTVGLVDELSRDGIAMAHAAACVVDATPRRCHEVASRYWFRHLYDWWIGLAYGVIDGEWSWFFHSWLTPIATTDERIEASTSLPKLYYGVRVRAVTGDLAAALAQDPPS